MGRHEMGRGERVRGTSGRDYTLRCHVERGARQWYVGTNASWGTPFQSEPLARQWVTTH